MNSYILGSIGVVFAAAVGGLLYRKHKLSKRIQYVVFDERAIIPKRATDGSIGYDISIFRDFIIPAHETIRIPTGFGIKLPRGYFAEIHARSSLSMKNTTIGAGIIDEDYTKEISVIFVNLNSSAMKLTAGSTIAQFKIHPTVKFDNYEIVSSFEATTRTGGFGSTNPKK
jgi:dUTP pyrophosphatase